MSNKISIIQKSLKVRLYPTSEQEDFLNKAFGCYRFAYNFRKNEKDDFYDQNIKGKSLSKEEIKETYKNFHPKTQKELCDEYTWLRDIPAITVTAALRNCEDSYTKFYKSLNTKSKRKIGFPKFKSRKENRHSFPVYMLSRACLDFDHRSIKIPKLGSTEFAHAEDKSQKWIGWYKEATPKHMTISRNPAGEYWCSILFEKQQDTFIRANLDRAIGLDFSPNSLYVNDLNETALEYEPQKQLHLKQLKHLQRNLARKKKGSKNREKARVKLARLEQHIVDSRRDYIEKETLRLVRTYDLIGIEDLNLVGMMKFSHNAKNYVDASWSTFVNKLIWKAKFNNCLVIQSDRFYPSSKTCHHCGYVNENLKLSDRVWTCPDCGKELIRDQNAATNLKDNVKSILCKDLAPFLGMEHADVMSVEDVEVIFINDELCGASYETERPNCEVGQEAPDS